MVLKRFNNDEASIQGLALLILMLVFAFGAYMWLTVPLGNGIATAVTAFWAAFLTQPDAAYRAGFANIAALNSSQVIGMLSMILSGFGFLVVGLRSKFSVN